MKKLYFYNNFHYGDCLVSLHFLDHLSKANDIDCVFMCHDGFHWQLQEFISNNPRVTLEPLPEGYFHNFDFRTRSGPNRAINLWCCPSIRRMWGEDKKTFPTYSKKFDGFLDLSSTISEIWKYVCSTNDLIYPFKERDDLVFDQPIFFDNTLDKDYDFLLVNSYCHSGQMKISPHEQDHIFSQIIDYLKLKGKTFITTHPLGDNECTLKYNMSLVKIGQLSKRCKVILGVPTAPLWICVNKPALQNCVSFINYTNDITAYDFMDKTDNINDLNILSQTVSRLVEQI